MPRNHMSDVTARITSWRIENETLERLHRLAGIQQAETGRRVIISDMVREALQDYLRKHEQ